MALNCFNVIGRCTKDGSVKTVGAKGIALLTFSIANNTGWGDNQKTNFFDVQVWGSRADTLSKFITKGKQVAITGSLECNRWTGQDGVERQSWVINANDVTLLADSGNTRANVVEEDISNGQGYLGPAPVF